MHKSATLSPESRDELLHRVNGDQPKPKPQRKVHHPLHVKVMRFCGFTTGYICLGLGWIIMHIGQAIYWFGRECKNAARDID